MNTESSVFIAMFHHLERQIHTIVLSACLLIQRSCLIRAESSGALRTQHSTLVPSLL